MANPSSKATTAPEQPPKAASPTVPGSPLDQDPAKPSSAAPAKEKVETDKPEGAPAKAPPSPVEKKEKEKGDSKHKEQAKPNKEAKADPPKPASTPPAPKSPSAKDRVIEPLLELFETGFKKKPPPPPPLIKVGQLNLTPKNTADFDARFEAVMSRAADGALLGAVNAIARPIKRRLIRTMAFAVIWSLAVAYGLHEASKASPITLKDLVQIGALAVVLPASIVSAIAHRALR